VRARTASSIVLAALIAVGTSSCTFITPQATRISYFPSDGFDATVGEIEVRNAIRTVTAAPGLTKYGAEDSQRIVFDSVEPTPGSLTKIYIQYGDTEGVEMDVPVLNGDQETYTQLVPGETGSTPDTTVTTTPGTSDEDQGLDDDQN
jgi:hypothetical protein